MSSISGAQHEAEYGEPQAPAKVSRHAIDLFTKAQAGDRGAYGQIVSAYQDRLYNAVVRLVGDRDEAAEITQEAFTKGLEKVGTFRGDSSPYTWLFRIAVNLAISQLRKVQRQRTFSLDSSAYAGNGQADDDTQASSLIDRVSQSKEINPAQRAADKERDGEVLKALGRLDAEYRAVLVMRDIDGFDYQQMADMLGLPLGTLKSRLFRARLALRDELKGYFRQAK
jgi:RNA polymerase sigma-70 factor (ECF subfamily)